MTKFLESVTCQIAELDLPKDIQARRKTTRVQELAASIKAHGLAHLPVVEAETGAMVVGRDRIAALLELGQQTVEVRVVEGTHDELKALELSENLHRRRDDVDELRSEYVEVLARIIEQQGLKVSTGKAGRPKTPRGEAVDAVAAASGVSPAAVRKSIERAADDEPADPKESIEQARDLPPPVETWGVPVEHLAQEFAAIRVVQAAVDEADRHMRAAQSALKGLNDGGEVAHEIYTRIYDAVHEAAFDVRFHRPKALCPYCKGLRHLRAKCQGCSGFGYIGATACEGIESSLLATGSDARVIGQDGEIVSYSEATTPKAEKKPAAKKAKPKLRIEDADGNPIKFPTAEPTQAIAGSNYLPDSDPNNGAEIAELEDEIF